MQYNKLLSRIYIVSGFWRASWTVYSIWVCMCVRDLKRCLGFSIPYWPSSSWIAEAQPCLCFVWLFGGFLFPFFCFFILQNSFAWINNSRLAICFLPCCGLLFTNIYSGLGFAALWVLGTVCSSSLPGVCICSWTVCLRLEIRAFSHWLVNNKTAIINRVFQILMTFY